MALCYYCDQEAVAWIDWVVYNIPGDYGGGQLISVVAVCQPHHEMIADVESVIDNRGVFS